MDIILERVLSFVPKKPDGKFVHGAKKEFCDSIGAPQNIISDWISNRSKSYNGYLYEIASKYNVSVEWLKGETDEKKPTPENGDGLADDELIKLWKSLSPEEIQRVKDFALGMIASRLKPPARPE